MESRSYYGAGYQDVQYRRPSIRNAKRLLDWKPKVEMDSVGFKLKDYITWTTYKIVINTDTVVNYTGPVPEGGYAGWYDIYYKF